MDLVMFRHDGKDEFGAPKGHGALFSYSGFNLGYSDEAPKLLTVNNIRNAFLFEVSKQEYQAAEAFIDMLRENGMRNPYYFSRVLNVAINRERNLQKPMQFDGSVKEGYEDDLCDHFSRPSDAIPLVGINCAYLAIEIVQTVVGIDLRAIHPSLPDANTGVKYESAYQEISRAVLTNTMPNTLDRDCIVFDQEGQLLGVNKKKAVKPEIAAPTAA
jgi:hypothetical protein